MSIFDHDFKAHLQASTDITNTVGNRVFPEVIPQQGQIPAITYSVVFGAPSNSLDGFTSGMTNYQVQVDCWSRSYEGALSLSYMVRDQLNTSANTFNSVIKEFPGASDFEEDTKRYRRMVQVSCWHHE